MYQLSSPEELRLHLETAEKAENNHLVFKCTCENTPLQLVAQLKYADMGDCGKSYAYLYQVSLQNAGVLIMDTDPLYDAGDTFRMFEIFASTATNPKFFFDGEK